MTQEECRNLDELIGTLVKYHPEAHVELVEKAYHFAEKAHEGQQRKSGEPYFSHPLTVASILAKLMLDAPTIAAGLLHDTVDAQLAREIDAALPIELSREEQIRLVREYCSSQFVSRRRPHPCGR